MDRKTLKHKEILEYRLPGDWIVVLGRNDAANDHVSLCLASPNDYWFHVRGAPGSHVILKAKKGAKPDRALLKQAAAIAAHHSKAAKGGVVSVSCTLARYVTKPHKAAPGTVQIRKETVLKVRPALPESSD